MWHEVPCDPVVRVVKQDSHAFVSIPEAVSSALNRVNLRPGRGHFIGNDRWSKTTVSKRTATLHGALAVKEDILNSLFDVYNIEQLGRMCPINTRTELSQDPEARG